jgi:hypothetical protein
MHDARPMTRASAAAIRLPPAIAATIAGFSLVAVYSLFVSIHTIDVGTGAIAATESLKQYREALAGLRDFPYQWRLLGVYMVFAGERLTGLDPHSVDVAVKAVLLCASSTLLFLFSRLSLSAIGSLCAVGLYLVLTVAGFTEPYAIYFTNDFALIACWFGAVYFVRTERFAAAAALTFIGAFAKETMLLVPVLLAIRWTRNRAPLWAVVLGAVAFALPTAMLRSVYRAPLTDWAWWHMLFANVPFLQSTRAELVQTLKNNLKVALFFNLFWILAARRAIRNVEPFLTDLALTGVVYLLLAYPVIYIRELRHFLPLVIVVLPAALIELTEDGPAVPPARPSP